MPRTQETSQAPQLNQHSVVQPHLEAGELQGRIVISNRDDWGLSNKMICIYATCLLAGSYFSYKGSQEPTDRRLQAMAVFLLSISISAIGLSLSRWHTALQWQNIFDRLYRLEGQIRARDVRT